MSDADSDDQQEQETLIVCDLKQDLSIDELHTAKAALTGAGFVLEEDLSTGQLKICRAGPDDQVALPDEYQDQITDEIDQAIETLEQKLDRIAGQVDEPDTEPDGPEREPDQEQDDTEPEQNLAQEQAAEADEDVDADPVEDAEPAADVSEDDAQEDDAVDTDKDSSGPAEDAMDDESEDDEPLEEQVNNLLETGRFTQSEIAEQLGINEDRVQEIHERHSSQTDTATDETDEDSDDASAADTEADGADDNEEELSALERRYRRLDDAIEENTLYTSDELAAIAFDKDEDEVTTSNKAYLSQIRAKRDLGLKEMKDPNGTGGRKLYYRGEKPTIEETDDGDADAGAEVDVHPDYVADCPECDYREEFQNTDKADAALDTHLAEEHGEYADSDDTEDTEGGTGKNRPGTRQAEAVNPA